MNPSTKIDWRARFPVSGPILAGWGIAAAFVAAFSLWSGLAPLASATIASGELVVAGSRKVVQHLEGGILSRIFVKDGDHVSAGQPLVELDKTEARSRLDAIRKRILLATAAAARLKAERDGLENVTFPDALLAQRDNPWIAETLQRQLQLFEGRRRSFQGQAQLFAHQVGTLKQNIQGLLAQKASVERQLTLVRKEHAGTKSLYEKGYATLTRVLALERAEAQLEGEHGNDISEIASAQKQIGEIELKIVQLHKEFYVRAVDELADIEKTLAELPDQEAAAADVLRRTSILAPSDGVVIGLAVHTPGEVIAPGAKLLEIVPQSDKLVVKATLPLSEISDVKVGQDAEIKFTSLHNRTTPTVLGEVSYLSADRVEMPNEKTPHYEVKVALSSKSVALLGNTQLIPGMPAEVFIHSGSRTLLQYLSQPVTDAFHRTMREK